MGFITIKQPFGEYFLSFFPSTVNIRKSKSSMYRITRIAINNLSDFFWGFQSLGWPNHPPRSQLSRCFAKFPPENPHGVLTASPVPEKWDGTGRRSLKKTLYTFAPPQTLATVGKSSFYLRIRDLTWLTSTIHFLQKDLTLSTSTISNLKKNDVAVFGVGPNYFCLVTRLYIAPGRCNALWMAWVKSYDVGSQEKHRRPRGRKWLNQSLLGWKKTSSKVKLQSTYWLPLDPKTMKDEGSKPQIYGL